LLVCHSKTKIIASDGVTRITTQISMSDFRPDIEHHEHTDEKWQKFLAKHWLFEGLANQRLETHWCRPSTIHHHGELDQTE